MVLRWHVQRGDIVFPKSHDAGADRIFEFELDETAMDAISALDRGESGRTGPHPDRFDYVPD